MKKENLITTAKIHHLAKTSLMLIMVLFMVSCEDEDDSSIKESMTLQVNGENFRDDFDNFYTTHEDGHIYLSGKNISATPKLDVVISMFDFPVNATGVFEGYDYTSSTRSLSVFHNNSTFRSTDWGSKEGELPSPVFTITENTDKFVEGSYSGMVMNSDDEIINVTGTFTIAFE